MAEAFPNQESAANTSNTSMMIINPANQINAVKLTDENFLLWNLQILAGIRGLGLECFLVDAFPVLSRTPAEGTTTDLVKPAYVAWCRQDQLLFSFLLASMTEGVQSQMIGCDSSAQLWPRVTSIFATRSKAKIMQYKLQLQTLKKGNLSMREYLLKMKNYMYVLAACGHPVSEEDQVLYVLGGVGLEYDSVVLE